MCNMIGFLKDIVIPEDEALYFVGSEGQYGQLLKQKFQIKRNV